MSKRAFMTAGMWMMVGLLVPLFIGCGGGGGTTTDLATVSTSSTSGSSSGLSSSDIAALISAAVGKAPTFTFATPTFSTTSGGAGLRITITATAGTGTSTDLSSVTGVTFAGSGDTGVYSHPSTTTLTVLVPQGAKNGLISLKGEANTAASTSATAFEAEPIVTGVSDPNIVPGRSVTIVGRNFCAASAVTFNTTTVTLDQPVAECTGTDNTQTRNTKLTVTVPASVTLPILASVLTPSGSGTASSSLTVSATSKQPTILAFTPSNGGSGMLVSLTGTNFMGGGSLASVELVSFAGVAPITSGFMVVSDTLLSVQIPAGARNGLILVSVANKTVGQSAGLYSVEPIVRSITPNIARAGITTLTVLGSNFCGASLVSFNATSAVPTSGNVCSGFDNLQDANTTVTAILPAAVTGPVTLISILTPNGTGTPLLAPTQTSTGRVALLTSVQSGTVALLGGAGSTFAPRDIKTGGGMLYFSDPLRARLISVNPATGTFLTSFVYASGSGTLASTMSIAFHPDLNSVLVATGDLQSYVLVAGRPADAAPTLASFSVTALASLLSNSANATSHGVNVMTIRPVTAVQHLVSHITWFADSAGGTTNRLLSVYSGGTPGPPSPAALGSISYFTGRFDPILAIAVTDSTTAALNSVWFTTTLGSYGVVQRPFAEAVINAYPLSTLFPLDLGLPAGLSISPLESIHIAAGPKIAVLASTNAFAGLYSLPTLASFGVGGTPLVSSLAFDLTTAGTGNLWYADVNQSLIVRCVGSCNTAGNLTSFDLRAVGGTRPRTVAVDTLGSVWFDEPDAIERLMP